MSSNDMHCQMPLCQSPTHMECDACTLSFHRNGLFTAQRKSKVSRISMCCTMRALGFVKKGMSVRTENNNRGENHYCSSIQQGWTPHALGRGPLRLSILVRVLSHAMPRRPMHVFT